MPSGEEYRPKPSPRIPLPYIGRGHSEPAVLQWYNIATNEFRYYAVERGVYQRMASEGVFLDDRYREIVLLVHGWHHHTDTYYLLFESLLRGHQKVTPRVAVLYVNWESQGANATSYEKAANAAVRVDLSAFLVDMDTTKSNLHCVGHSIGAHACAAICRQYYKLTNATCARIVGIDPAGPLFLPSSPGYLKANSLARQDAKYVAVLATNRFTAGPGDAVGDEFLTANVHGMKSEVCANESQPWFQTICISGYAGNSVCEDFRFRTDDVPIFPDRPITTHSCSHRAGIGYYFKFLDVASPPLVIRKMHTQFGNQEGFLPSVWSPYVVSKDYTYDTFFGSRPVWYSFTVNNASFAHPKSVLNPARVMLLITDAIHRVAVLGAESYHSTVVGAYRITVAFGIYSHKSLDAAYIHSPQVPYVARLMHGWGFDDEYLRVSTVVPMTHIEELTLRCSRISAVNSSYNLYFCSKQFKPFYVPHYRSFMNVNGRQDDVPPQYGCLMFPIYSDVMVNYRPPVSVEFGSELALRLDSPGLPRVRLMLEDDVTNHTLLSLWDRCGVEEPKYIEFRVTPDRRVTLRFNRPGRYWLRYYSLYDVTVYPISVLPRLLVPTADPDDDEDYSGMGSDLLRDGGPLQKASDAPAHLPTILAVSCTLAVLCVIGVLVVVGWRWYTRSDSLHMPESLSFDGHSTYRRREERQVEGEISRLDTDA
ncbi:ORF19 [Psittacine aviadenovirus B]|uniref:ORF19 n=1 Tax=psittacine adenovirus 4 TaxID=2773287 RepID=A0A1P8SW89_9ADEN|nr:ORF19 [Psittacine aviadenovirus B]APY28368.1 ORF19 [psittacine adenovirus 4]